MSHINAEMRRPLLLALCAILLVLVGPEDAAGRVIGVPSDFPTIQEAVEDAAGGDTVLVGAGTYDRVWSKRISGASGEIDVFINVLVEVPVTLLSETGAEATVILSSGRGPVIVVTNARGVVIDGFTIRGGAADETVLDGGGGIYCEYSDMEVRNSIIEENSAPFGAGIACFRASGPWIHDNVIRDNGDCEFGGGVALMGGSSGIIESNVLAGNRAEIFGGAVIINEQSSAILESNTVVGNHATSGSGFFCRGDSEVDAAWNIFALGTGGVAVYCDTLGQGRPCIVDLSCNDFWQNAGGDIRGCAGGTGNRSTNPFFCSPEVDDFSLCAFSPSLGADDPCGSRGALPSGCFDCPVAQRRLSWGALKALYGSTSTESR